MDRRAVVVQQAWKIASLVRVPPPISSAASSTVTSTPALARVDRGGQAVGPGADDDRRAHATAGYGGVGSRLPASDHVTWVGIGPLGSHGCSLTASDTFQVPRSITPRAASMTL